MTAVMPLPGAGNFPGEEDRLRQGWDILAGKHGLAEPMARLGRAVE